VAQIIASDFMQNPWRPERAPQLTLTSQAATPGNVQGEGFEPPTNSV
jgi:hypothetical protein